MEKINLLKETVGILEANGKKPEDVYWVGTTNGDRIISWAVFKEQADFEYEPDSIGTINRNLIVTGNGWWLERHMDDISEWWEFKSFPEMEGKVFGYFNLRG